MNAYTYKNINALDELTKFISELGVSFKAKYIRINNYNYDIIVLNEHNLAIIYTEFWSQTIKYHLSHIKIHLFKKFIDSVHINRNSLLQKPDIIKSKIRSIFNLNNRIYARKTKIVQLNTQQTTEFINENGLFGPCSAKYKIGLSCNNTIVMIALFSNKRIINRCGVLFKSYELIRVISLKNTNVIGGINKLIDYFISTRNPDDIMTYIDLNWYRSNSFSKLNFKLLGITCTKITPSTRVCKLDDLRNTNLGSVKFIKYIKKI